jgi:hypothetical protein
MSAHLDRDQLVRWRDQVGAADREVVLGHLAVCPSCAASYAELVRTAPTATGPTRFNPAEFAARGYAVRGRVARQEAEATSGQHAAPSWLNALWHPPTSLARVALVANVLLALLLVGVALPRFRDPAFTTLSGPASSAGGARLTVIFQPDAAENAVRRTLLDLDARIVSGPSAVGIYVVELRARTDDDRAVQTAIDRLRGVPGVVQFVEREP